MLQLTNLHIVYKFNYIRNELEKMINLENINIRNYVVVDNELIEIDNEIISMSKSLAKLKNKI